MMTEYKSLADIPAALLAQVLVYRIFQDNAEPAGMDSSGSLMVQSITHDDVRRIVQNLVNDALKDMPFKDKED